jgi:hypothetical protein
MKGDPHGSIFPLKLLMAYVVFVSLNHLIFAIKISDSDNIGRWENVWNWTLGWSLVLCVPLFGVITSALWHFRKMPVFAVIMILAALWHIGTTLWFYICFGFDPRFNTDPQPLYFFRAALICAVPFVVVYLVWRFWPRKQANGLPAP